MTPPPHIQPTPTPTPQTYEINQVEIEGTSGEGSQLVRAFRRRAHRLFSGPFKAALLALPLSSVEGEGEEARVRAALLAVYEAPERHPQLYTYAKALELLETGETGTSSLSLSPVDVYMMTHTFVSLPVTGLVSGFYYGHFCLAKAVIGLEAKGTMHRAVSALKRTYETPLFPLLDQTRSTLGARTDTRLQHRKGNLLRTLLGVPAGSAV